MEKIDGVCCKNCPECKYYKNREIDPFACLSVNAFATIKKLENKINGLTMTGKNTFVDSEQESEK